MRKCKTAICVYVQNMPCVCIGFVCTNVCMIMRYDSVSLREFTMGVDIRISVHMLIVYECVHENVSVYKKGEG